MGSSLAISDSQIVAGAPGNWNSAAGLVNVYGLNNNDLLQTLQADDKSHADNFGASVAIYGTRMVVGAPGKSSDKGAAYIFDSNTQMSKSFGESSSDKFGYSVAISDSDVVVSAPYNDANGNNAGSVTVFDNDGTERMKSLGNYLFGESLALDGKTLLVGEPNSPNRRVRVYDITNTPEVLQSTLQESNVIMFGLSVAINSDYIVVGSSGESVHVYNRAFTKIHTLTATNPVFNLDFGWSVAISASNMIVIGSYPLSNPGKAWLFDATTGDEIFEFERSNPTNYDFFGKSVAIHKNEVAIGSERFNDYQGAVYRYTLS